MSRVMPGGGPRPGARHHRAWRRRSRSGGSPGAGCPGQAEDDLQSAPGSPSLLGSPQSAQVSGHSGVAGVAAPDR
jgi:hypothetical protein